MPLGICVTTCAVKKFLFHVCEIFCFSFASMLKKKKKKTITKKVDLDVSIVSSYNELVQFQQKKKKTWVLGAG